VLRYHLSEKAETDLQEIITYTLNVWGMDQVFRYVDNLYDHFELLGNQPAMGRACSSLSSGLRRFEVQKHVVFYLPERGGILVVRVLHGSMVPRAEYFEG
jgi:toxin ParE1/3/4